MIDGEIDVAVGDQAAITLGQAARLQDGSAGAVARAPMRRYRHWHSAGVRNVAEIGERLRIGRLVPISAAGCPDIQISDAADDAAAQERHQQHEHCAKHQFPRRTETERRLQKVLQK